MHRVEDLLRAGKVRVALFPPQFDTCAASGELRGWPVDLARAAGARLGIQVEFLDRPDPRKVLDDLKAERADLAFLSIHRSDEADFTPPFLRIDFGCLVPAASTICSIADVDQPGIRITVVRDHASTLALSRIAKQAELVPAEVPDAALDLLRSGRAHVLASVRPWLLEASAYLPGSRILEESYGANVMGAAVPKGHVRWLASVREFIAEARASGLIQQAIERAGWRGARVVGS